MSVRERLETQRLSELYAARLAPPNPHAAEDERRARLAQNARKIQEDRINLMLLQMSEAERECVYEIVNRERPDSLGSATVIEATLLRVRTEGVENLREAMDGTTREEQSAVWEILKTLSISERLGMDGGRACKEALRQVRSENYLED